VWHVVRSGEPAEDWLAVERHDADGVVGRAWWPFSEALRAAVEGVASNGRPHGLHDPSAPDAASAATAPEPRLAYGLMAFATADATCRRHTVSLPLWLGGLARDYVRVAWTVAVPASDRSDSAIARRTRMAREAASRFGVTAFALRDASADPDAIARAALALRAAVGNAATVMLQLEGQLDGAGTRRVQRALEGCDGLCVGDPCSTLGEAVEATRGSLPALGLSADRYPRSELLECLVHSPPTVLLVDPVLEGGPEAVRHLAAVARVLQVDVSLTAERGGRWLTQASGALAASLPSCRQPVVLPELSDVDDLATLGVRDGTLGPEFTLAGCHDDHEPARGQHPGRSEGGR
jgi:L-alanine-DL-glutamate epimerase-like enolase superfamily enzyme